LYLFCKNEVLEPLEGNKYSRQFYTDHSPQGDHFYGIL